MRNGGPGAVTLAAMVAVASMLAPLGTAPRAAVAHEPARGTQAALDPCGSEVLLEAQLARDPTLAARREAFESMLREAERNGLLPKLGVGRNGTEAAPIYTIPIVVHIVHSGVSGDPENISDTQVLSQIEAINRDCQNLPGNGLPAVDCQLKFCLASNGPTPNYPWPGVPGITRKLDAVNAYAQVNNDVALKAIDYFPSNQYLNVWVVKAIQISGATTGIVGYANFPATVPLAQDGIVMDYRVMGANNTSYGNNFTGLLPTYDEGKVFAHEVGHWLNLYHTFHNGCGGGDLVADTPPEGVNATGCPAIVPSTCTSNGGDPIHNFMDYTNDPCRWQFTGLQRARMYAAITTYRSELVSPINLQSVGACPSILTAVVTLNPSQVCTSNPVVQCTAPICGGSCSYAWTFENGTGNTTLQSTSATFSGGGPHKVTVTMSDGTNSSTASGTVYVTACAPISGPCTNWVFGSKCRLNFASGMPVAVSGTVNLGFETSAQISNSAGALLFYTDNETIWNTNNVPMANSAGLIGGKSSHTGALIAPRPNTPNQYYQFSVREFEAYPKPDPLHISTIDMGLNGGLGDVVSGQLNKPIILPVGVNQPPQGLLEGMTLLPHCNGNDWWLITCGFDSTNTSRDWERFVYVTPITQAGAGVTVAYAIGFADSGKGYSAWGTITGSRDGTKFAICQSNSHEIHVYNFDRATGVPTLALNTGPVAVNQDVAFSPDGKLLYYTYLQGAAGAGGISLYGLRQMELATQQVRTVRGPTSATYPSDVELGPDDKIYSARSGQSALDCVNYPNNFNTLNNNECGFNPLCIPLGAGSTVNQYGALPNTLPVCGALAQPPAQFSYTVTGCTTVHFTTPNCATWSWSFGDGGNSSLQSPTHSYAPGTYTVTLTTTGSPPTATQLITMGAQPITLSGPSNPCGGPSNYSVAGPSNYTYVWTITGGTPATFTGSNVFVNWGPGTGTVSVTGTDPATGCTSSASKSNDGCPDCYTPPLDMVAWWPLDETGAGTLAQDIVAANDGQDVNAPTKVAGAVSNCRQFPGNSLKYVGVNDTAKLNLGTSNLTLDAWINTASGATFQGIIEKRALGPDLGYALYLKQGQLAFLLGDGSTSNEFTVATSADLADGRWHHVAATEDRNDANAGTRLYVDGAPIGFLPGYAGGSVTNTERLLIGAQAPSNAPTGWFGGKIDEVEIFNRALTGEEIARIWGSGSAGKCKAFTYVPTASTICAGQNSVTATISLCNFAAAPDTFNLTFAGLSGAGCTGAGPTTIQLLGQTNPVGVPKGSCNNFTLKIDRPNDLTPGNYSCYVVTATSTLSGVAHVSHGSLWANELLCPHLQSAPVSLGGIAVARTMTWQLANTSPAFLAVPVSVDARASDGTPMGPAGVVSLNGLPPGVPWTASYFLAPGESTQVSVDAEFAQPMPFRFFDIVLAADADGNGTNDTESAAGLFYSERPVQVLSAPKPAPSGKLELLAATPNPFSRALDVQFELARPARVRLALYDVSGRRVRTLVDGFALAGRAVRTLDAVGLNSGVYFLRLETGDQVRTRRVVLLRE